MADKDFGVKRINLVGATGTPTITSPTDLIINANKVAISTNATVGGSIGIGTTNPTSKLWVGGDGYFVGVVTANEFSGKLNATSALTQSVGFATTATNLAGGNVGNIPYQSSTNTTAFVANGTTGQVLISNGNDTPQWGNINGSFGGITVRDEGDVVGTSNSITTLNFVGSNLKVTGTTGANGIATITMSDNLVGSGLSISGISTLGTVKISSGIVTSTTGIAVTFYGDFVGTASSAGYATTAFNLNGVVESNFNVAYAQTAGIATYATKAGVSTDVIGGIASVTSLFVDTTGISTLGTVKISSGIITSTTGVAVTFYGDFVGTASSAGYATTAFNLNGVVESNLNVAYASTAGIASAVKPNSVGLGTDTFGDYVKSISGISNEIEIAVTGGTGESSTPTVGFAPNPTIGGNVTIGNDLQVNRNLNVNGNITIGGTTGYILVENFRVSDADIILGFTTNSQNNEISNDTTASHGGIAIASTEGTPLVSLNIAGIETLPATYKKIMWFKAGAFAGLNTDAWLSNYAIGIGSTQFPVGTRLAAGAVQFTENDLAVVRNINASGIITASSFNGNASSAGIATNLKGGLAGNVPYQSATDTTAFITNGTSGQVLLFNGSIPVWGNGGISVQDEGSPVGTANSITTLDFRGNNIVVTATSGVNGIATITVADYVSNAGIATFTSEWILGAVGNTDYTFTGPGFTGAESDPVLYLVRGQQYKFTNTMGAHPFRIQSTPNGSTGTQYNDGITNNDVSNGTLTWNVQFDAPGLLYYQCTAHGSMGGKIYIIDAGIGPDVSVNTTGTIAAESIVGTSLSISGISTFTGIGTFGSDLYVGGNVNVVGVLTANRLFSRLYGEFVGGSISGTNIVGTSLSITGISTFSNGPVIIGSASSTGTASQPLQVTGGTYFSGSVGIGTTTPSSKLSIVGDVNITGILTANRIFSNLYGEFTGGGISGTNIVGTSLSISGISTLGTVQISSGIVTATSGVVTYYGDGQYLSGVVSPESNGEFYTGVSSSLQLTPLSYETTLFTFPSTAGKQYVIESINVANVDTSVGVGTTVNIIASIQDTSGEQTYIAYNVPIVNGGLIELLKNAIVAGPSDVIKMWVTNGNYVGVNNAAEVYMNYTEFTSTDYIREYASTVSIATTDVTGIFTSTTYPSVIQSIHLANRTDTGDYPVSVTITNGVTTTFLAKDLVIPRYATVDILDRAKRIELNGTIGIKVGQTSTIDVIIAGKQITS